MDICFFDLSLAECRHVLVWVLPEVNPETDPSTSSLFRREVKQGRDCHQYGVININVSNWSFGPLRNFGTK